MGRKIQGTTEMNKLEMNYIQKQIERIKEALKLDLSVKERRKLIRKKSGLELLRESELAKGFGVVV